MNRGIILYGPPASGKDTITQALTNHDPRCQLFPRLKVGPGKTTGYRMTTEETLNDLRDQGQIIWENHRYAATYAVDRPELTRRLLTEIPVLHLGQAAAINAIKTATPGVRWLTIELRCRRNIAEQRLTARNPADVTDRLTVWDETPQLRSQDLRLDTGLLTPAEAVAHILPLLR